MPKHRVAKGEWIGGIAASHGHVAWQDLWKHGKNSKLRKRRDPNLLVENDRVYVPPVDKKKSSAAAGSSHRFVRQRQPDKLILRFVEVGVYIDLFGAIPYTIELGSKKVTGKIEAEGAEVEVPLELAVEEGVLWLGKLRCRLDVGGLDPRNRLSGVQARIRNLGWDAGPVDNLNGPKTKRGVRNFQRFYAIKIDGRVGGQTRTKLKEVCGC